MDYEKALKSIGKVVNVSDGSPRPPERFNKKLEKWEYCNFSGVLEEVSPTDWHESGYRAKILIGQNSVMISYFSVDLDQVEVA